MGYANAKVIQKNEYLFVTISSTTNLPVIGETIPVPTSGDGEILGEYYAVPVKDDGVFRGYEFTKAAAAPTYDSILVLQIKDKLTGDTYWVAVTQANYLAGTYTATTIPTYGAIPERSVCVDDDGNYVYTWGVPTDTGTYTAYVGIDGAKEATDSTGATLAALVTSLNTNSATAGTWSAVGTTILKLVSTVDQPVGVVIGLS